MIDAQYLRSILSYDPLTGEFTWLVRKGRQAAGKPAGCASSANVYINIIIDRVNYDAHRLAWLYMTGEWPKPGQQIDHKNRVRTDNSWVNLRIVTGSQNLHNTGVRRNNTSGIKGVKRSRNKWEACIQVNGKSTWLGRFDNLEQASAARKLAERKHHV